MDNNSMLMIAIGLLVLLSGYFSSTETAFSSLNRIRLKNLSNSGDKKAKLTLGLSENFDTVLSTILIGNNIVNIIATSLSTVLFTNLYGARGVSMATIFMTVLVLIFGEITPKSLAKESPEKFAMFSSPIIQILMFILKPINFIFEQWKKVLSKVVKVSDEHRYTEDELLTMIDEVQSEGGLNEQEGELIRSAIEFNDLDVTDVLTPRVDLISIDINYTDDQIDALFIESGFSRLPVYENNIDNIIGVLNEKNFNYYLKNREGQTLKDIIKPIVFVTPTMKISRLLKLLQKSKNHMAIITDEYGGTVGIVTLEDILEELVGEIWDEHDEIVEEITLINENEYKVSGNMNIDKMLEFFDINEDYDANTVSGFVIQELGKIPNQGDTFIYQHLNIIILKTESRRVNEINVKVLPKEEE